MCAGVAVGLGVAHDLGQGTLGDASISGVRDFAALDFCATLCQLAGGALGALQDLVLRVALQVARGVLLGQRVGLLGGIGVGAAGLGRLDVAGGVVFGFFGFAYFGLGHAAIDAADVDVALRSVHLVHFVARGLHLVGQLIAKH